MIEPDATKTKNTLSELLKYYGAYIAMFGGMALITGSIVHAAQEGALNRSAILLFIGIVLFIVGSYLNEIYLKSGGTESPLRYIALSLLLAMGVGMMGGGLQHFSDTPIFASFLIPIGILLSLTGFTLRNNYQLSKINVIKISFATFIVSSLLFVTLFNFARSIPQTNDHNHSNNNEIQHDSHKLINDDYSFVINMIPHHQEAIEASKIVLARTQNSELKSFATKVISAQTKELTQLKEWYRKSQGTPYRSEDSTYAPMMPNLTENGISNLEVDSRYISGMIAHHDGAIQMARAIIGVTKNSEIKTLANAIIITQTKEAQLLTTWKNSHSATDHHHGS